MTILHALASLLLGCTETSREPEPPASPMPQVAPPTPAPRPAPEEHDPIGYGWRLESDRGRGTLFGTLHVGIHPRWEILEPSAREAFESATALAVEVDIAAARPVIDRYRRLPPGESLSQILGAETFAIYQRATNTRLDGLRPWAAFVEVSTAWVPRGGSGLDAFFTSRARTRGIPIHYLETPETQFEALDRAYSADMLREASTELPAMRERHRAIIGAFMDADPETAGSINGPDVIARYQEHYHHLMSTRNNAWMERLVPADGSPGLVQPGADVFIAVGASHLTSVDNLVDQFRARGFTVTRLGAENAIESSEPAAE